MNTKDTIIEILRGTGRRGIEDVIEYLESSNFFTAQCHRHHKYVGGLADHSLEVYTHAKRFGGDLNDDTIAIVCLLHDICTSHKRGMQRISGHGLRSVKILEEECGLELSAEERNAIQYHMHHGASQTQGSKIARLVCHGDVLSAAGLVIC